MKMYFDTFFFSFLLVSLQFLGFFSQFLQLLDDNTYVENELKNPLKTDISWISKQYVRENSKTYCLNAQWKQMA